jgi:hypothetical protein
MLTSFRTTLLILLCNIAAFAGVTVSAPGNGSVVGTTVQFVASASSDAGLPTTSMMIYVDDQNKYLVYANSLNTTLSLSTGSHNAVVKSWDSAGHLYSSNVQFTSVAGQSGGGSGGSGVTVSSPTSGAAVGNSVHFTASATSPNQYPITSMMIYVDDQSMYSVYANSLDTYLNLGNGSHNAVVKSWNAAGAIFTQSVPFSVGGSSGGGGGQSGATGVTVSSPSPGANLASPAHFVASAVSDSSAPITAMMIYVDDQAQYTNYQSSLDTYLNLGSGNHTAVVKSWNAWGAMYTKTVQFSVGGSAAPPTGGSGGNTISNIQALPGWNSCSDCAGAGNNVPVAQYSMTEHLGSPSLTGNATQFWLGGDSPYANAIWWKNLSAGSDASHFTYDLYFYMDNPSAAEALEFDVNLSYNGRYYVFGTQCSPLWSHTWDTWDMNAGSWNSTGISCPTFPAYTWNHVTLQFERTWDNKLHFVSIAMNGNQHYVDRYVNSQGTGYSNGVSVDFQMDGDYRQTDYSVWLDKVNLSYY